MPSECGPPVVYAFKDEPRNMIFGAGAMAGVRGVNCRGEGRGRLVAATVALAAAAAAWFTARRRRPGDGVTETI
jgi:hypothetical protein